MVPMPENGALKPKPDQMPTQARRSEPVIPDKPTEHEPWSEVGVAALCTHSARGRGGDGYSHVRPDVEPQAAGSAVGGVDLRPEPFFAGTFGHIGSYPVLYAQ
jgi:hypothetical protein